MADQPSLNPRRVLVGLALTAVGGFVDCFSYLSLRNVFTATMSGNTVLIAVNAGRSDASAAVLHAYTIGVFVLGLLVSSVAIELGLRSGVRRVLTVALVVEALCLAAVALWGGPTLARVDGGALAAPGWPLYALVGLTAAAMGVQNTSLRMAGVLGIFTTHVTGTLTRLCEEFVNFLFYPAGKPSWTALAHTLFSAGLWLAFLGGALLASALLRRWGPGAELGLAIAVLAGVIAADLHRPFAEPRAVRPKRI